jgi:hypothetical protein
MKTNFSYIPFLILGVFLKEIFNFIYVNSFSEGPSVFYGAQIDFLFLIISCLILSNELEKKYISCIIIIVLHTFYEMLTSNNAGYFYRAIFATKALISLYAFMFFIVFFFVFYMYLYPRDKNYFSEIIKNYLFKLSIICVFMMILPFLEISSLVVSFGFFEAVEKMNTEISFCIEKVNEGSI